VGAPVTSVPPPPGVPESAARIVEAEVLPARARQAEILQTSGQASTGSRDGLRSLWSRWSRGSGDAPQDRPTPPSTPPSARLPLQSTLQSTRPSTLPSTPQPSPAPAIPPGADSPDLRPRRPRRRLVWLGAAVVVLVGLVAWLGHGLVGDGPAPLTRADVDRAVADGITKAQEEQRAALPDAAQAYRTVLPSLVVITTRGGTGGSGTSPSPASSGERSGLGAGVVVKNDGSVLTAFHVVDGGGRIQVRFSDGTTSRARIAQQQPERDIAILAVDTLPQVVVPAVLGGGVGVGDDVFAVGNPLGLTDSLSAGVVSALDRDIKVAGGRQLEGLIQFDAAVNPGNSGGPLLDRNGQVVGVVTGLANPAEQAFFVGIGFAVPIGAAGGTGGNGPGAMAPK